MSLQRKSRDFIAGYIAAINEGRTKQNIEVDYGFGPKGFGLYVYKHLKHKSMILFFALDNSEI